MRFVVPSSAKINLSLRVTSVRTDGYHNILSLFLRLPPLEALVISPNGAEDEVTVQGLSIEGKNIVAKALESARKDGFVVPPLNVEVQKNIFPGSGLGAGSGNAAAMLCWLAGGSSDSAWLNAAAQTGADVPFLFSEAPVALVSGIGEVLEPLEPLSCFVCLVFPLWSVGTENAYGELDRYYDGRYAKNESDARIEAMRIYDAVSRGEMLGLLPNDFTPPLMARFPHYEKIFNAFVAKGSYGWGITGSGGAAFALFRQRPLATDFALPDLTRQVIVVKI